MICNTYKEDLNRLFSKICKQTTIISSFNSSNRIQLSLNIFYSLYVQSLYKDVKTLYKHTIDYLVQDLQHSSLRVDKYFDTMIYNIIVMSSNVDHVLIIIFFIIPNYRLPFQKRLIERVKKRKACTNIWISLWQI